MPSSGELHLAFLGCGAVTRLHSRTLRSVGPGLRRSYASRDPATAERMRVETGGERAFASYDAAIADPTVDVVLIATPPTHHLEWTLKALAARKHVIVEKPPFPRAADFDGVERAARTAGRRVFVAENYFYKPVLRTLRSLLAKGAIGEPRFLDIKALKTQRTGGWRDDPTEAGGGALFEGGIHWIDFIANLGLDVESARGARPGPPGGLDREMLVTVRYRQGAVGALFFSWGIPSAMKGVRLSRIYGTEGSIAFESNGLVVVVLGRRRRIVFPGVRDLLGYRAMFRDFLGAIRDGREAEFTLAKARRDVEIVEEIYRSVG